MHQLSDIPRFEGNESPQEAEQWLETLIACTGSFSDAGIFRLLTSRFPSDSPAREWFDQLEGASGSTWLGFERQFRTRWIAESQRRAVQEATWDAFAHHFLITDAIFGEGTGDSTEAIHRISTWAEDHLLLGYATKCDGRKLMEATGLLLPPFIRAYIQVYVEPPPVTFEDYCRAICEITTTEVDSERIRRQIASRDQISAMQRKIEEISEQVKHLVATNDRRSVPISGELSETVLPHGSSSTMSSADSIAWEPCSPVTSAMSVVGATSNATSELSTPIAQPAILLDSMEGDLPNQSDGPPEVVVDSGDGTDGGEQLSLFRTPATWRKPVALMTKKERIAITQKAIDFMLTFGPDLTNSQATGLQSTTVIFDRMLNRCDNKRISIPRSGADDALYSDLLSGILGLNCYSTFEEQSRFSVALRIWQGIAGGSDLGSRRSDNIVLPLQRYAYFWGSRYTLHAQPSGEQTMAGGLFTANAVNLSSIRTILFMTLATYLAECTNEIKHREIAILTANCVKTWMIDSETSLVKDCLIDATTAKENDGAVLSCHLTGLVIEGLSVLASITNDESWSSLAIDIAMAAIHYDGWHSSEGVLISGSDDTPWTNSDAKAFKGLLNRGLLIAYQRNRSNKPFCNVVRSYINVQCNALLELSRFRNSYGGQWEGPYTGPYAHAQMAAIDTLVASIGVNDN